VSTVIESEAGSKCDRHQRWDRVERAELFAQYVDLKTQGISQRQAATMLQVPRSTLQAWRVYQERLDAHPAVVTFFHSPPGLAFMHRLSWPSIWSASRWVPVGFVSSVCC